MPQSLPEIFNAIASEAHDAFPERLKKLVIFFASVDMPVYISPDVANQLTKDTAALKKVADVIEDEMEARNYAGEACVNYSLYGTPVDLIGIEDRKFISPFPSPYTQEMRYILTLDHEIGHIILRNGSSTTPGISRHLAETAASTYAILQHVRRFGTNTDHAGDYIASKAADIILCADTAHYAADAVEEAFRYAEAQDISGLTLRETADLTEKIADKHQVDEATLAKIRDAYKSVRDVHEVYTGMSRYVDMMCTEVVSIMKDKRNDADIFKAGKRFLHMEGYKAHMAEAAKTENFWREAIEFINTHDPNAAATPRRVTNDNPRI